LKKVTKEQVVQFFDFTFFKEPKAFEHHFISEGHKEEAARQRELRRQTNPQFIEHKSVSFFKKGLQLLPDY